MSAPPVGRFAPSPSGRMHLGNALTALLAWLSVKSRGGRFVLRIEDLDPARCRPEYASQLMDDLCWLGLTWDEGPGACEANAPYFQSQCTPYYEAALAGCAVPGPYTCYCSRADLHAASAPHLADGTALYAGTCRGLSPHSGPKRRPPAAGARCALPCRSGK
ncbi:MAG: glutamate--tRNA ligase family protein [Ruthenibacterium sp.]